MAKHIGQADRIAQLKAELDAAEREYHTALAQPPADYVAEMLHEALCRSNHTDGCGWLYSNWTSPDAQRMQYRAAAEVLLRLCGGDISKAENFVSVLNDL